MRPGANPAGGMYGMFFFLVPVLTYTGVLMCILVLTRRIAKDDVCGALVAQITGNPLPVYKPVSALSVPPF
jgi:hypothetical protein